MLRSSQAPPPSPEWTAVCERLACPPARKLLEPLNAASPSATMRLRRGTASLTFRPARPPARSRRVWGAASKTPPRLCPVGAGACFLCRRESPPPPGREGVPPLSPRFWPRFALRPKIHPSPQLPPTLSFRLSALMNNEQDPLKQGFVPRRRRFKSCRSDHSFH
jgi:hypothetical protein